MAQPPQHLQGLAYVPGQARGVLRLGPTPANRTDILVIHQDQFDAVRDIAAGFIVLDGAPLSHNMIRLLGLGVPTVSLEARHAAALHAGTEVLLDGARGSVTIAPPCDLPAASAPPSPAPGQPVQTADGEAVQLLASVRHADTARQALTAGATAIGLVRSEFFDPADGSEPDAACFEAAFRGLCEAAEPLPVTIRLLDASPDKRPAWLPDIDGFGNALGLQGTRLFGNDVVHRVVAAQLDAIGTLAAEYPLRVILPYLTRHEELRHWAAWVRRTLPSSVRLGAMIETPISALDLASWFDTADFLAVGCNDLMQCLFAADRDHPALAAYLDSYAPPLYRFFKQMAEAAGEHLAQVQLCGLLPQLQGVLPVLVGLGYRRFSVDPPHIPYLADSVNRLAVAEAQRLAEQVCAAGDSRRTRQLLGLPADDGQPFIA